MEIKQQKISKQLKKELKAKGIKPKQLKKAFQTIQKSGYSFNPLRMNFTQKVVAIEAMDELYNFYGINTTKEYKDLSLFFMTYLKDREEKCFSLTQEFKENSILMFRQLYDLFDKIESANCHKQLDKLYREVALGFRQEDVNE